MSEDVKELNEEELEQAAGGRFNLIFFVYECNDCKETFSNLYDKYACPYCNSENIRKVRTGNPLFGDTREDICEHFADADFAAGRCADIDGWD